MGDDDAFAKAGRVLSTTLERTTTGNLQGGCSYRRADSWRARPSYETCTSTLGPNVVFRPFNIGRVVVERPSCMAGFHSLHAGPPSGVAPANAAKPVGKSRPVRFMPHHHQCLAFVWGPTKRLASLLRGTLGGHHDSCALAWRLTQQVCVLEAGACVP